MGVILTGLLELADTLPSATLSVELYLTPRLKAELEALYAHILEFLLRAKDWFEEGWAKHLAETILRPLKYSDILDKVRQSAAIIRSLAVDRSNVEQRQMHREVRALMDAFSPVSTSVSDIKSKASEISVQVTQATAATSVELVSLKDLLSNLFEMVVDLKREQSSQAQAQVHAQDRQAQMHDMLVRLLSQCADLPSEFRYETQRLENTIMDTLRDNHQEQIAAAIRNNHVLTDLQFSSILSGLKGSVSEAPEITLQASLAVARQHIRRLGWPVCGRRRTPVWDTDHFKSWKAADCRRCYMTISGPPKSRRAIMSFFAMAVNNIREAGTPVLWLLPSRSGDGMWDSPDSVPATPACTVVSSIKSLAYQAMMFMQAPECRITESDMAFTCRRFQSTPADDISGWLKILASVLAKLPRVYVVVDDEALSGLGRDASEVLEESRGLTSIFNELFEEMRLSAPETAIKVLMSEYSGLMNDTGIEPGTPGPNMGRIIVEGRLSRPQRGGRASKNILSGRIGRR
ncbi:hypothetical protein F503_02940 [Ophiostoma piceae UAMH 11346]|uniref:DUF7708 domain-containing protein n=1 Tax=Ophiostoma piceae (strain UAMH 11346) TaxID=1262450 RepID=S3C2W3_OPHP1|nr:hypothetical protein F503_02940 [Ophiostoma piceae UAMH 11346]